MLCSAQSSIGKRRIRKVQCRDIGEYWPRTETEMIDPLDRLPASGECPPGFPVEVNSTVPLLTGYDVHIEVEFTTKH